MKYSFKTGKQFESGEKSILSIYFKSDFLNCYILISFEFPKKKNNLELSELKFFQNKSSLLKFLETMNLKLMDECEKNKIKQIFELKETILDYLTGKNINLFEIIKELGIDLRLNDKFHSKFSQKVYSSLLSVKYGELTNYSEIGEKIGSKAYRAIGNILRGNPIPLIIPCHRVIKKNGEIGGFMGISEKSWQQTLKKKLIEIEHST